MAYTYMFLNWCLSIWHNSFHSFFDNTKTWSPTEERVSQHLPALFTECSVHCAWNVHFFCCLIHAATYKFCAKNYKNKIKNLNHLKYLFKMKFIKIILRSSKNGSTCSALICTCCCIVSNVMMLESSAKLMTVNSFILCIFAWWSNAEKYMKRHITYLIIKSKSLEMYVCDEQTFLN